MEVSKERMIELVKNAPEGAVYWGAVTENYYNCDKSWYLGFANQTWSESPSVRMGAIKLDYSVLEDKPVCKGKNCQSIDGLNHSSECIEEHEANVNGTNTAGNRNPDDRYAGYVGAAYSGSTDDQQAAYKEGVDARNRKGETLKDKPVYTKEMQEAGELPPVGCEFKVGKIESDSRLAEFKGRTVNVLGLSKSDDGGDVITFQHPSLGVACGCFVSGWVFPVDTRTDQEKLIDELMGVAFTVEDQHGEVELINAITKIAKTYNITRKGESND